MKLKCSWKRYWAGLMDASTIEIPVCPNCDEPLYDTDQCVYCGQEIDQDDERLQKWLEPPEVRPISKRPDDCGNCKHWHEWPKEKQMEKIRCGDCDKIWKGAPFEWTDRHGKNHITPYAGWSFEDENYNDDFRCFEPAEE